MVQTIRRHAGTARQDRQRQAPNDDRRTLAFGGFARRRDKRRASRVDPHELKQDVSGEDGQERRIARRCAQVG